MVQRVTMLWNRKQPVQCAMAKAKELVLSPAEKAEPAAKAAWPTGFGHLWLKRAPAEVPVARRVRPGLPRAH